MKNLRRAAFFPRAKLGVSCRENFMKLSILFLYIFMLFLVGCQQQSIQIEPSKIQVQAGKQFHISTVLEKQNNTIENSDIPITFQCKNGKIENDIYYAPMEQGEDVLSLYYNGKECSQKIILEITAPETESQTNIAETIALPQTNITETIALPQTNISNNTEMAINTITNQVTQPATEPVKEVVQPKETPKPVEKLPSYSIDIKGIPGKIQCGQLVTLNFILKKDAKDVASKLTDWEIIPQKGKINNNKYKAPYLAGKEAISIKHIPTKTVKEVSFDIEQTENIIIDNQLLKMTIPYGWDIAESSLSLNAATPDKKSLLRVCILAGVDFLEPQMIGLFLQYGDKIDMGDETEIALGGIPDGVLLTFNKFRLENQKAWWALAKKDGLLYVFSLIGTPDVFEKNADNILKSLTFKTTPWESVKNIKIEKEKKTIEHNNFSIEVPRSWESTVLDQSLILACSPKKYNNKTISLTILNYSQHIIKDIGLDLVLDTFTQGILSDTDLEVGDATDIKIGELPAKQVEMIGENGTKLCLVVTKHEDVAYGIIFSASEEIYKANPNFLNETVQTFKIHQ